MRGMPVSLEMRTRALLTRACSGSVFDMISRKKLPSPIISRYKKALLLLFIGPAIPAIFFMTWFAFVLPDKRMPVKPPRFGFVEMLKTFWVNPIAHPDYALAWWGRFLITFATYAFTTYRLMYLIHRVDLTQAEATRVVTISVLIYTSSS